MTQRPNVRNPQSASCGLGFIRCKVRLTVRYSSTAKKNDQSLLTPPVFQGANDVRNDEVTRTNAGSVPFPHISHHHT